MVVFTKVEDRNSDEIDDDDMEYENDDKDDIENDHNEKVGFEYYAIDDDDHDGAKYRVTDAYLSPPLISQQSIMIIGISLYLFFVLFFTFFEYYFLSTSSLAPSSSSWWSSFTQLVLSFIVYLWIVYEISLFCTYSFKMNDDAIIRRQLITQYEANDPIAKHVVLNISNPNVSYQESYWTNSRGMVLQTGTIVQTSSKTKTESSHLNSTTPQEPQLPDPTQPQPQTHHQASSNSTTIICYCHGYLDNPCYSKRKVLSSLVGNASPHTNMILLMITYEGHGKSDGALGLINNIDYVVEDVSDYYQQQIANITSRTSCSSSQCNSNNNNSSNDTSNVNIFLMGESMGGAIAFQVYQKLKVCNNLLLKGVILISPMCKISRNMLPSKWIIALGTILAGGSGSGNGNSGGKDGMTSSVGGGATTTCTTAATTSTCSRLGYLPISPAKGDLKKLSYRIAKKRKYITRVPSAYSNRNPRLATSRELLVKYRL